MAAPFMVYFAGIGTVVAAMSFGFGGALFLTDTSAVKMKEQPAAYTAKRDAPNGKEPLKPVEPPTAEPVVEQQQQHAAPAVETTGSRPASDTMQWVDAPPSAPPSAPRTSAAPVIPTVAPLTPVAPPRSAETPELVPTPVVAAPAPIERPAAAAHPVVTPGKDFRADEKRQKDAVRAPTDQKGKHAQQKSKKPANAAGRPQPVEDDDDEEVAAADPPERVIEMPSMKPVGAVSGNAH